jgi:asparaginyl-tRNA synthetase
MRQVYINQLAKHVGEQVTISGWLYNSRSSGKLIFPQVRDGSGVVQCVVFKKSVTQEVWDSFQGLGQESALSVSGSVRSDERAPGGVEIDVESVEVVQRVEGYPITPKEHGTEFLMDHRHLWLRSRRQHAILKVRHTIVRAVRDFLDDDGFTLCDTPILTPAACEGTTTLFEVDYFDDDKAYLSQSANSTTRPRPPPSVKSTASARPSAPSARRRAGI